MTIGQAIALAYDAAAELPCPLDMRAGVAGWLVRLLVDQRAGVC